MPRILLVEDDPQLIEALTISLRDAGFEVISGDRMDQAVELFNSASFDLVITDFHIAQGSGRRLLNEIRKTNKEVPIILITGTPYVDKNDFLIYGFSEVFLKPFRVSVLLAAIEKALKR
jgi:two-component system response regulator AtoC